MLAHEPTAGVRMVLQVSVTHTVSSTLHLPFGTRKSESSHLTKALPRLIFASDFLKERLFGLSNPQGNHGESIKEAHFHLDNVPTVSLQPFNFYVFTERFSTPT